MKIFHVDSFTDRPFGGNSAGVCILAHPKVDSWMQSIAAGMNLAVTAFLIRQADGYLIRWFSPKTEIDLCAYAVLASAHILWQEKLSSPDSHINFYSRSGNMRAFRHDELIGLDLPIIPDEAIQETEDIWRLLGMPVMYAGKNKFDHIVELESEELVRNFKPDRNASVALSTIGLIITGKSDNPEYDFAARSFCLSGDYHETPITGSAVCCLAPFWARRLNRDVIKARQAFLNEGNLTMTIESGRLHIYGHALTIIAGNVVV